jgi:hypothetical protein
VERCEHDYRTGRDNNATTKSKVTDMRVTKISEVASLENKEAIPSIIGTLTKVWDYKTGEGEDGAWSMQGGSIKDDSGEIKILFKNQPDARKYSNKLISITSHSSSKGISGVYADDNSYKDSVTRQIKVTATAEISLELPRPTAAIASVDPKEDTAILNKIIIPDELDPVKQARKLLMQVANAFYLCEKMVHKQSEQSEVDGVPQTPENQGGKCGTAYRELKDAGLVFKMPLTPLWGAKEQLSAHKEEVPF